MKTIVISFLMSAALVACGGKSKKQTTPSNTSGSTTDTKASGSATGGQTYGGAMTPTGGAKPAGGGTADPCGGM